MDDSIELFEEAALFASLDSKSGSRGRKQGLNRSRLSHWDLQVQSITIQIEESQANFKRFVDVILSGLN